jgi:hypothetical protein
LILAAERVLREDLNVRETLSIVGVQTTHPKYLAFAGSVETPAYVLEFGSEKPLRHVYDVLDRLGPLLRERVAHAVLLRRWNDDLCVLVQTGLEGAPWFEFVRTHNDARQWLRLGELALDALSELQGAVRQAMGPSSVVPAAELDAISVDLETSKVSLTAAASDCVRQATLLLASVGTIEGWPQHGDYSLNNIVLGSNDVMRVIDFEEFASTRMPLQDEVGLAMSMALLAPAQCQSIPLSTYLDLALRNSPFSPEQNTAFVVYNIVHRIKQAAGHSRRRRVQDWLLSTLEQLTCAGERA